jgi:hypothetical protein
MTDKNQNDDIKQFETFLDKVMLFEGDARALDSLDNRADILEKMIEHWRFRKGKAKPDGLSLRRFLSLERALMPNGIISIGPGNSDQRWSGDPLRPQELQLPLLLFLLVQEKKDIPVLEIIESFVDMIRPYLAPFDMEKTRTGVIRCFTNTRFAANVLRNYGLLRYTQEERFRTWKLSFLGLLVAGLAYNSSWQTILDRSPSNIRRYPSLLSLGIGRTFDAVSDPDIFQKVAQSLYDSRSAPFLQAQQFLGDLHRLVTEYIAKVGSDGMLALDKRKAILTIVERVEANSSARNYEASIKKSFELTDFSKRLWKLIRYERGLKND